MSSPAITPRNGASEPWVTFRHGLWDNEINVSLVTVKIHWTNHGAREVALTTVVYSPTDASGNIVSPGALP